MAMVVVVVTVLPLAAAMDSVGNDGGHGDTGGTDGDQHSGAPSAVGGCAYPLCCELGCTAHLISYGPVLLGAPRADILPLSRDGPYGQEPTLAPPLRQLVVLQGGGITHTPTPTPTQERPLFPGLRDGSVDDVDVQRGRLSCPAWVQDSAGEFLESPKGPRTVLTLGLCKR